MLTCKEDIVGSQTTRHHLGETAFIDDKSSIISALLKLKKPRKNHPGAVEAVSPGTAMADANMLLFKELGQAAEA